MPLLSPGDIESLSPLFRGKGGRVLSGALTKLLSVDDFCRIYDNLDDLSGPDFARAALNATGTVVQAGIASGEDCGDFRSALDSYLPAGPFITVSNHPYGGIDGMILADLVGGVRPSYKIIVNKILSLLKAMSPCFITVTPTLQVRTAPDSQSLGGIREALSHLRDGCPLGVFPSGAVSDLVLRRDALCSGTSGLDWKSAHVRDREWQDPMVRFIMRAGVPVVPVRFFDGNSLWYYLLGLLSWKVRLARLPREVINKAGKRVRVGFGKIILPGEIPSDVISARTFLRKSVYDMEIPELVPVSQQVRP